MSRRMLLRVGIWSVIVVLLAISAPVASAQGPVPTGTYNVTYYNYVSDEGGAGCPSGGNIAGGTESGITHFWPEGASPYGGVAVNNYTVCWDGQINFPQSGNWTVNTIHDDGLNVWVGGQIAMRAWYDTGPSQTYGTMWVNAGVNQVIVKYYNRGMGGTACVWWSLEGYSTNVYCPQQAWNYGWQPTYTYPQPYVAPIPTTGYYPGYPYYPYYPTTAGYQPPQYYYPPYNGAQPPYYYPPYTQYNPPYNPYTPYTQVSNVYGFNCSYTIVQGDTLKNIAIAYGTTWELLAQVNGIANANLIHTGNVLRVPCK